MDCYECAVTGIDKNQGSLLDVVEGVMKANTFARQEEVKAWEQEITPCEHTLCLEQGSQHQIASQDLGQCTKCDLKENLWLCLTCGNLGCGRAQYGGVGGNSHALAHGKEVDHPVAVKLGSLTAEGTADIYCYSCDDERKDPELPAHLAYWGVNIADRQKTEKSLTEMQIEHNLTYDFSMTTKDGNELKPLFGEGLTGLKNLGNSCYLNSVLQCLFDMPELAKRYHHSKDTPPAIDRPAEDLETQLRKLADGLLSGRYAHPDPDVKKSEEPEQPTYQKGLAPAMLKQLIGKGHSEFSTMRQQDAFELFLHLLQLISRSEHPSASPNPVNVFKFAMEQRLQCSSCKKVRYRTDEMENITIMVPIRKKVKQDSTAGADADAMDIDDEFEPVTFKECLDIFTETENVELTCSACGSKDGFTKRSLFKTFPDVLAVNCRRFDLVNWLPTKMDVPVIVGDDPIPFDSYKSSGLQPDEETLPEDAGVGSSGGASSAFVPNDMALAQLEAMGFPRVRCEKALKATGNSDAEAASLWLFEHMEDPDIDVPEQPSGGGGSKADAESVEQLGNMGFSVPQAKQALRETGNSMEAAVEWLFSHPDAQGDIEGDSTDAPADSAQSGEEKPLAGSEALPANFQLQSIVCHKGASIHAG